MTTAVIIYGRPGCGKSRHAQALAHRYGKTQILDGEWQPGDRKPANALILTNIPNLPGALDFATALRTLRRPHPRSIA